MYINKKLQKLYQLNGSEPVGTLVIPVKNANGHSYTLGNTYRLSRFSGGAAVLKGLNATSEGNYIPLDACMKIFETPEAEKAMFLAEAEKVETTLAAIKQHIALVEEYGTSEMVMAAHLKKLATTDASLETITAAINDYIVI